MLYRTPRRSGFSLTEVLVALFVMAVGIISLLTLFPLGAVQMGHALRDDRVQTTALQADAYLRLWWQREIIEKTIVEQSYVAMTSPGDGHLALSPAPPSPSYPVLLDPIGFQARNGPPKTRLAGQFVLAQGFPRRTINALNTGNSATDYVTSFRACSLMDDLEFSRDPVLGNPGTPAPSAETGVAAAVVRGGRYNWSAVIQQPNSQHRGIADLKILVFERRAPGTAPADAEMSYVVNNITVGSTQLTIPDTLDNLKIRVNGWIMDGTIGGNIRNANFYRIQSIAENVPTAGQTTIELQTPIKAPLGATGVTTYNGRVYILNNLVEVFDRPQLKPGSFLPQSP
jgi:prepilin-type N-terminal cleavage/methylation domain-containing protein